MHIVIDLILLAIVILNVILSSKNGFVKTLIEVVGFVLAIVISLSLSAPISGFIYDKTIEPAIVNSVAEKAADTAGETAKNIFNAMPKFVKKNADDLGVTEDKITRKFENKTGEEIKDTMIEVSQDSIKPVFVKIVSLAIAAILFVILMILVKFLAKVINKLFSFSIIGTLNHTLGAVLGFGKGVLVAIAVCMIISMIVSFTTAGFLIFTKEAIDKTHIFNLLTNILSR